MGRNQQNGLEFNMEAGRELSKVRSDGKSPDLQLCHDIFEKFGNVMGRALKRKVPSEWVMPKCLPISVTHYLEFPSYETV